MGCRGDGGGRGVAAACPGVGLRPARSVRGDAASSPGSEHLRSIMMGWWSSLGADENGDGEISQEEFRVLWCEFWAGDDAEAAGTWVFWRFGSATQWEVSAWG